MDIRTTDYKISNLIGILFPRTGKIYYECRGHLNLNYFKTILAMFRIVTFFRVDYSMSYKSGYSVYCWHFGPANVKKYSDSFLSGSDPYWEKLILISTKEWKKIVEKYDIKSEEKYYCNDVFVAGYNVVFW